MCTVQHKSMAEAMEDLPLDNQQQHASANSRESKRNRSALGAP